MNKAIIFSGNNDRAIIAYCRFFEANKICFHIVSSGQNDLINLSEYKSKIIYERNSRELDIDLFKLIRDKIVISENEKIVIIPSSEFLNRFLVNNLNVLEDIDFLIPLVTKEIYSEISDKYTFGDLCGNYLIDTPKEYKSINEINFPFVAKPKFYFIDGKLVNEKPLIIEDKNQLENFISKKQIKDFYFQEFIGGNSYYLLYYFDKLQNYSVFSQQNLIQQDQGLSIIAAKSSDIHKNEITNKFANLLIDKKFRGLIMIEVKHFNNKFYMIEANPRVWGPSQLIIDSEMDLIYRFSVDYNLIDDLNLTYNYKLDTTYFWSGGLFNDSENKYKVAFHNYTSDDFIKEYNKWINNDIYLREDTLKLYLNEINK